MAVVNTKSTFITNADATPVVKTDVTHVTGVQRSQAGTVEVAAADSDTSVYRIARVSSLARVNSILLYNDAITAGTDYHIGLYQTAANGGAVVDADCYASSVDLSSAHTGTEVAFEARDVASILNKVWQDAGLSADSGREYDICLTGNTVGTAAGTISLDVRYVLD